MTLSLTGEDKNKYQEPQIKLEPTTLKVDLNQVNQNLEINFSNKPISENESLSININLKRFDDNKFNSKSYNLNNSPKLSSITERIPLSEIIISDKLLFGNDLNHNKLQTKVVNVNETKNIEISNLFKVSFTMIAIIEPIIPTKIEITDDIELHPAVIATNPANGPRII